MVLRVLTILFALCLLNGCDDGGGAGDSGSSADASPTADGAQAVTGDFVTAANSGCADMVLQADDVAHIGPGAGLAGRVVDTNCNPLAAFKVLCCTDESCVPTDTMDDGSFYLGGVMNTLPRKIRVVGVTHDFYDGLFYLGVEPDQLSLPDKAIILPPLGEYVDLDAAAGGTALLAGGQLELTVAPEALKYPLGHFTPNLSARRVSMEIIGPFESTPWEGHDGAMAFVFDPYDIEVDEGSPAELSFHVKDHAPAGSVYDIWASDTHDAHMLLVGTATVDADGVIHSGPGATITTLQTIVIVPQ